MKSSKFGMIWSQNINLVTTGPLTRTGVLYPRVLDFLFCFPFRVWTSLYASVCWQIYLFTDFGILRFLLSQFECFIHLDLPTGWSVSFSLPEWGLLAGSSFAEQGVPSCSVFTRANFHFVPGLFLSSMFSSTFFLLGIWTVSQYR